MSNILLLTNRYIPNADASGICVSKIAKQLILEGHNVTVISIKADNDDIDMDILDNALVYRLNAPLYVQRLRANEGDPYHGFKMTTYTILRKISILLRLSNFPDTFPDQSEALFRKSEKIILENQIDCVISSFRPFSTIAAAIKIKKKYPHIICGGYYLDILKCIKPNKIIPDIIFDNFCDRQEIQVFKKLDFILMAEGGKDIYNSPKFFPIKEKIHYINFPIFNKYDNKKNIIINYEKSHINLIYAGHLNKNFRNPKFFFDVLVKLCMENYPLKFHIYGNSNCDVMINNYCTKYPEHFIYYGQVDQDYAAAAIFSADIVVNFSNKMNYMVPSKIFELFASCKPIINIINNPEDQSIQYFDKYPMTLLIKEYSNTISEAADKLRIFLDNYTKQNLEFDKVKKVFYNATPESTTKIITKYLEAYNE